MTHLSPTVYSAWSIQSTILLGFLLSHLWKFDRFKCLSWKGGRQTGAFRRFMTFAYITSVPLLCAYSISMAVIKYSEGYLDVPGLGVLPTPYFFWSNQHFKWILPLHMVLSIAWSLELVSHLEELCFWLFLIGVSLPSSSWFRSWYFRIWAVGSVCAMVGMPLATWLTRDDVYRCEAVTFFTGSLCSCLITLWSLKIVWAFPRFIDRVRGAGGDPEVVMRLMNFQDLNFIRVIFRFMFVAAFLTMSADGLTAHRHINESLLWTDLLALVGAAGLLVSSAITLLIFFPRSLARESGYTHQPRSSAKPMALPAHSRSRSHSNTLPPGSSTLSLASRRDPYSKLDFRFKFPSSGNAENGHFNVNHGPSAAKTGANYENTMPGVIISQVSHVVVDMDDDEQDATPLGIEQYGEEERIPYSSSPFFEDESKENSGESENAGMDARGNRNESRGLESSGLELGTEEETRQRVVVLKRERSVVEKVGGTRSQPVVDAWEMVQLPSRPRPILKDSSAEQQGEGSTGGPGGRQGGGWGSKMFLAAPWDEPKMELPMHPLIMNYSSPIDMDPEAPSRRRTRSFNRAEYAA